MTLKSILSSNPFNVSIEIFPPKSAEGDVNLFETLNQLVPYKPGFISCTYGAGGSTQARTLELCQRIQKEYQTPVMAHLTCVGTTKDQLVEWIGKARTAGVNNIMALRGDAPKNTKIFQKTEGGLGNANELVSLIREHFSDMGIGVAAYPEKHPEATCADTDLNYLKLKVDAGADAAFTQLFFNNDAFLKFRDRCDQVGISIPVVPGIMPITDFAQIKRITTMCGSVIPDELASKLETVKDDLQSQFEIGVSFAIDQCRALMDAGVPGIHFYALNKSHACERILGELGMVPTV